MAKVSKQEFEWREWKLGEARYSGLGPMSQPRPSTAHFPAANKIPQAWHYRLRLFLARRKLEQSPLPPPNPMLNLGVFAQPGACYRAPDAGVEDVADAHAGGLRWALLCLDAPAKQWAEVGRRLDLKGIPYGWWFHCRTVQQLQELLAQSERDRRPIVGLNVEAELGGALNPQVIADTLTRSGYRGQVATILYGWVQNGVDCRPIGDHVALLEVFPQDAPDLWDPRVKVYHCLEHARIQGLRRPVPLYGCYAMSVARERQIGQVPEGPRNGEGQLVAQPSWYDRTILHGAYTCDDTGERWGPNEWGFREGLVAA